MYSVGRFHLSVPVDQCYRSLHRAYKPGSHLGFGQYAEPIRRLWKHSAGIWPCRRISQRHLLYGSHCRPVCQPHSSGILFYRRHYLSAGEKRRREHQSRRTIRLSQEDMAMETDRFRHPFPSPLSGHGRRISGKCTGGSGISIHGNQRTDNQLSRNHRPPYLSESHQSCLLQPVRRQTKNNGAWAHDTCCTNIRDNLTIYSYRTSTGCQRQSVWFQHQSQHRSTSLRR